MAWICNFQLQRKTQTVSPWQKSKTIYFWTSKIFWTYGGQISKRTFSIKFLLGQDRPQSLCLSKGIFIPFQGNFRKVSLSKPKKIILAKLCSKSTWEGRHHVFVWINNLSWLTNWNTLMFNFFIGNSLKNWKIYIICMENFEPF